MRRNISGITMNEISLSLHARKFHFFLTPFPLKGRSHETLHLRDRYKLDQSQPAGKKVPHFSLTPFPLKERSHETLHLRGFAIN
jgi:hypothetical protein